MGDSAAWMAVGEAREQGRICGFVQLHSSLQLIEKQVVRNYRSILAQKDGERGEGSAITAKLYVDGEKVRTGTGVFSGSFEVKFNLDELFWWDERSLRET